MSPPTAAFSFVDAITELKPGRRARGVVALPAHGALPPCLIAEAVGQLAAWVAMAAVDFRSRPVAALAGEVRIHAPAVAGDTLDLEVAIDTCEADAVSYSGRARLRDAPVLELNRCIGPMLPMEEFDDPTHVRRRFAQLCAADAPRAVMAAPLPPAPSCVVIDREPDSIRATLSVPAAAALYADHFPRRPLFPGTLLLDAQIRLALQLAADAAPPSGTAPRPACVREVKLRAFVEPAQHVTLVANRLAGAGAATELGVAAYVEGKRIATARVECQA